MTSYCYFCGEPCNGPDGEVICPSCYLDIDDKEAWEDDKILPPTAHEDAPSEE